jgi:hypothetical protein
MQYESMLIYPCCRLRTEIAIGAFEVEGGDAMLAEGAFERRPPFIGLVV